MGDRQILEVFWGRVQCAAACYYYTTTMPSSWDISSGKYPSCAMTSAVRFGASTGEGRKQIHCIYIYIYSYMYFIRAGYYFRYIPGISWDPWELNEESLKHIHVRVCHRYIYIYIYVLRCIWLSAHGGRVTQGTSCDFWGIVFVVNDRGLGATAFGLAGR